MKAELHSHAERAHEAWDAQTRAVLEATEATPRTAAALAHRAGIDRPETQLILDQLVASGHVTRYGTTLPMYARQADDDKLRPAPPD